MTSFVPRHPYSQEELDELYPQELKLQLVQVLLRHGERSPVSSRFQNAGLQPYWPYCNAAKHMTSVILASSESSQWDELKYRRRLETFGQKDDGPVMASGPGGEYDGICQPGELTDKGRQTTLALGRRLRHLYIDQLAFMPKLIADGDMMYLRATPVPRALESVQQAFWGLYPPSSRAADFPAPTIVTRTPADETLYPNDASCRRFAQLSRAFAQRTAERWNNTDDMRYLSKLYSKWMPGQAKVAVDSHPRVTGIMDTVNATDAHGPKTKLPKEFYDAKARAIIDRIAVEEWFGGYAESTEYRMLGIGSLLGDITSRMIGSIEKNGTDGMVEIGGSGHLGKGRGGETNIRFALLGCHDTTLAAMLTSLGAFEKEKWPPFTSHIAVELFGPNNRQASARPVSSIQQPSISKSTSWWASAFENLTSTRAQASNSFSSIARKPVSELTDAQRNEFKGYYVRIRYNDRVMQIPGCKAPGKHLEENPTICTLEAFKSIVDKFAPQDWKGACTSRLKAPVFTEKAEAAGYE